VIGDAVAGGGGAIGLGAITPPVAENVANRGKLIDLGDNRQERTERESTSERHHPDG